MNSATVWGIALPLTAFVASLGLLIIARRKKWSIEAALIELPETPTKENLPNMRSPISECIKNFSKRYRWEIILGLTFGAILIFALLFAPPRLNGGIAIHPNQPGRPFYNLRWARAFVSINYDMLWVWSSVFISLICIFLLAWVNQKRSGLGAQFLLLCTSLNLAGAAQWIVSSENLQDSGKILYIIAIFGFSMWSWAARKRLFPDLEKKTVTKTVEILIVLGLLLLTSFTRLYSLQTIPYGIEGDEAKWTAEAVSLGIRGVPDSSGEYHRDALPVSYYLQVPLHRLLGPSIFAARLTVVILSIMSTLLFYWLLRQITVMPVGAIATFLLSISIFDISASRLANVESFVKLWPILGLALLALAVHTRKWQVYGLSGLAITLGMLTYDTVWPLFGVISIIALIELTRQNENQRTRITSIAALIAPTLLALPLLVPYMSSRLAYYRFGDKGWNTETLSTLFKYFSYVIHTWFISLRPDFLYNRTGPLLNSMLLPLLVLGFITSIILIKKKISYWTLLWAGLVIFPIPILANSSMGRVYYPALPAVYVLIALGIYFFFKEINRFVGVIFRPILFATILVPLVWLPFANLFIYFNEVTDDKDRLIRREIGEFAALAAGTDTLILLPAPPGKNTPLNNEHQMLELYMLQKIPSSMIGEAYSYLAPENLLSGIESESPNHQNIEVIFDKKETKELDEILQLCYPLGTLTEGYHFSRFSLRNSALEYKKCSSEELKLDLKNDNSFDWELINGKTQTLDILCEGFQTDIEWLEAEDLLMSPGWQIETEFAPGWSGTGFVMDNYGSDPLVVELNIGSIQKGYIWVRYYERKVEQYPATITIQSIYYPFSKVKGDYLNFWKWGRIGPVNLDESSKLTINHPHDDEIQSFRAIFIDSFAITTDPDFTPRTDLWTPLPPQTFSFKQPRSSGTIRLVLPANSYRCRAGIESNLPVVSKDGSVSPTLISNNVEFSIR